MVLVKKADGVTHETLSDKNLYRFEVKRIVQTLETLPSPPKIAANTLKILTTEAPDIDEVIKLVESDQAIVMKILKIVNSSYFGIQNHISSIQKAVVMLGFSEISCVLLGVTISESLLKPFRKKSARKQEFLWKHSLACAVCAEMIAKQIYPSFKNEAFIAGLLHDVGKLIIDETLPKMFDQVMDDCSEQGTPWLEAEQSIIGIDHSTVGKWLAEKWNLGPLLAQAIWLHHHPLSTINDLDFIKHKELILIVHLADFLSHNIMADLIPSLQEKIDYEEICKFLRIKPEYLERVSASLGKHYSERASMLDIEEDDELAFYYNIIKQANRKLAKLTSEKIHYRTFEKINQELKSIHDLHLKIARLDEGEKVLDKVAQTIAKNLQKPEGLIYYQKKPEKKLIGRCWFPENSSPQEFSLEIDENGQVIQQNSPQLPDKLNQFVKNRSARFVKATSHNLKNNGIRYCSPYIIINLIIGNQLGGEIAIFDEGKIATEPVTEEQIKTYGYLASITETALSRIRLIEEIREKAESLSSALLKNSLTAKALSAEKERLAVTLRSIGDAVITTDTEGSIILINKQAEKLTSYTQEQAVGKPLTEVFRIINEKTRKLIENPVKKVLKTGKTVELVKNIVLIDKNGTERIIADSVAPIIDGENKRIGIVLVFRDITEKEKMEQEILKAQQVESVAILTGGIAHDFNNILTAISGNIMLAKMYLKPGAKAFEKLTQAEKASQRATDITRQMLTFSQGKAPLKKTGSIAELIKDSTDFTLIGSNVRCEFSIAADLWPAEVDEGQINQVINNVIINANQAMENGGIITLHAENISVEAENKLSLKEGNYVKIAIKDEGIGITKENLPRIFDPYFTTKKDGNGLGLATTYSIIKKHDGDISVDSKLGVGTTFYIYLPFSGKAMVTSKVEAGKPILGKGKILIMDDEAEIRSLAGEMLESIGYKVEFAKDGEEVIEFYKSAKASNNLFDVVIIDLTIRGSMGGKETIKKLREIDPNVKAILSSGYANDPIMVDCKKYGFDNVIAKPYKIEELSKVLHTTIMETIVGS